MRRSPIELVNLAFSCLMVLITVTGTIVFFFTDLLSDRVWGSKRYILGAVFLAYAVYRVWRMYSVFKKEKMQNPNS